MRHLHPERQADLALTGTKSYGRVARHLRRCGACRAELARLRRTADIARAPIELRPPPPHVWSAVTDALGFVFGPAAVATRITRHTSRQELPVARTARRFVAMAAAVLGVVAGSLSTVVVKTVGDRDPVDAHPIVAADVQPVGGQRARGSVQLLETDVGWQLRVVLTAATPIDGHYEVWLVHDDGIRLVSLGVLASPDGTFGLPPGAIADGYRTIDISVEPDDGDPQHSHHTIVRGIV